jgi:hypothetical protein
VYCPFRADFFTNLEAMRKKFFSILIPLCCLVGVSVYYFMQDRATSTSAEVQFFEAIRQGDAARVAKWIDEGAAVGKPAAALFREGGHYYSQFNTARVPCHFTPLMWAVYHHRYAIVRMLLQAGADPLYQDSAGYSAIDIALHQDNMENLPDLIGQGMVWHENRTREGVYPLHYAAVTGNVRAVDILLERGVFVDYPEHFTHLSAVFASEGPWEALQEATGGGLTALMAAAAQGEQGVVKRLLAQGADPSARARSGATARELAEHGGHLSVASLLQDASPLSQGS